MATVQCSHEEPWILVFMWMPSTHMQALLTQSDMDCGILRSGGCPKLSVVFFWLFLNCFRCVAALIVLLGWYISLGCVLDLQDCLGGVVSNGVHMHIKVITVIHFR